MRCIFCKLDSTGSKSVEHIIPEALGNTHHLLPPGVVCDKCNNYFAREVERPFLESPAVKAMRFAEAIPSKRGRVPPIAGMIEPTYPVFAFKEPHNRSQTMLYGPPETMQHIFSSERGVLYLPAAAEKPSDRVTSRFLAKAALEVMAQRLLAHAAGLEYLVNESQLDLLRDHARRGSTPAWPIITRRLYDSGKRWVDRDGNAVQLLNEFDIFVTPANEWYFILALFGLELAINVGGPEMEGYLGWLAERGGVSPLYWGKNSGASDLSPA